MEELKKSDCLQKGKFKKESNVGLHIKVKKMYENKNNNVL